MVVAEARRMRDQAQRVLNPDPGNSQHDPFAKPYAPSDDVAYKLVSKFGARDALAILRQRSNQADAHSLSARQSDERAERRERKRRDREQRDREAMLAGNSLGRRLDQALAALSVVAEGDTCSPDGRVSADAAHPSRIPRPRWDDLTRARATALLAVRTIEGDLDGVRRRALRGTVTLDRDERLRRLRGHTPEQVAIIDREQGSPRSVRERRREMRLDERTGDPIDERDAA